MRDDQDVLNRWLRRDLARQYGAALREPLPAELLAMLAVVPPRD